MKLIIGVLALLISASIATPNPPILPSRFIAKGNFWVFDDEHGLQRQGHLTLHYDWGKGEMRGDVNVLPEGDSNHTLLVIWQSKDDMIFAWLGDKGEIDCNVREKQGHLFPPTFLQQCKFEGLDILHGVVYKWSCDIMHIQIDIWTERYTQKVVRQVMHYDQKKSSVIIDYSHFHPIQEEFNSKIFSPPSGWGCK